MELEAPNPSESTHVSAEPAVNGESNSKRDREEGEEAENNSESKKQKVEKSVEEESRIEGVDDEKKESGQVDVGPKSFGSSVEMFDYFCKFLHYWPPNLNVNKYEYMVLLELMKNGYLEPEKKIGKGIRAFQVRYHPQYKSRCFFLIRDDESVDDFSFRKCVDHILPLPEELQIKPDVNKALGGRGTRGGHGGKGGGGGRGGGRSRGRGRGGKRRN
ncbi:unnamed protein product [Ilex paraguariensis]|uniref:Uncharacterized protein n=1 Tax=Ilex paraguariensis TaxID=185542 RepID=A0ABC8STY7_9AQUA